MGQVPVHCLQNVQYNCKHALVKATKEPVEAYNESNKFSPCSNESKLVRKAVLDDNASSAARLSTGSHEASKDGLQEIIWRVSRL